MTKTVLSRTSLGTPITITFEDNYDYIYWGNQVKEEHRLDKLPKTDTAYNVLKDFKGATSVMATYRENYNRCVIYTRKSPRCSNWEVHFCTLH